MKALLIRDDAGRRHSKFPYDYNDCTVRSLAIATGIGYDKAHDLLEAAGRKPKRGFPFVRWIRWNSVTPDWRAYEIGAAYEHHITVGRFAREHPNGNYILRVSGHVVPVIDGLVIDQINSLKARVTHVFKVTPTKKGS